MLSNLPVAFEFLCHAASRLLKSFFVLPPGVLIVVYFQFTSLS
jgi:hypothetical protein